MKLKTSDLTGLALDWAVAQSLPGVSVALDGGVLREMGVDGEPIFNPSGHWQQGGALIESENINLVRRTHAGTSESHHEVLRLLGWIAYKTPKAYWMTPVTHTAENPLKAAMRCLVQHTLGDTVEVPDALVNL